MTVERTLVLIKPDSVKRRLTGEIISRFERTGLCILAMKMMRVEEDLAARHYEEHKDEPFYDRLISFITSGDLVAMILEGESAIENVRKLMGPTNCLEATPGSIRGDFGLCVTENLVHGSDCLHNAAREISLFFPGL
ncbi:MAG: nucleoside-diphosphate kinase [Actinomycetota bacterium]|nr:nucleoside-diphosphate kinase [Actinomycetota bacterium]